MEEWRPVKGYGLEYEVSNLGNIRSIPRIIKTNNNGYIEIKQKLKSFLKHYKGYLVVSFKKDGVCKKYYVHRIVAEAFLDNPNNLPQVNHKDECKTNNCVTNLEWCTNEYNERYGTKNSRASEKLKGRIAHNAIKITINGVEYSSINEASKLLGISAYKIKKLYGKNS